MSVLTGPGWVTHAAVATIPWHGQCREQKNQIFAIYTCLFLGWSPVLLSQAYLSMVDLESRSGQDTGLDLAQSLADLVHGLVHYHDGGTCGPFQPTMLAVRAAQHAVYQPPAPAASTHSLAECFINICRVHAQKRPQYNIHNSVHNDTDTCCVGVMRSIKPLHHQLGLIHLL